MTNKLADMYKSLSAFRDSSHFRDLLDHFQSVIPSEKECRRANIEKKRRLPASPLFNALPQFTDPDTNSIKMIKLTRHMHPEIAHLGNSEIRSHAFHGRIAARISYWKRQGHVPRFKRKEYPVSLEGRELNANLIKWLLRKRLTSLIGQAGLLYE